MVDTILSEAKEITKLAAEYNMLMIPDWLEGDELRGYLVDQVMLRNPDKDEREVLQEVEEIIDGCKKLRERGLQLTKKHIDLAEVDPNLCTELLMKEYLERNPHCSEEWALNEARKMVEAMQEIIANPSVPPDVQQ
jgi:hypothetical protein